MTTLGPIKILRCPNCSGLFKDQEFASWNTFNAVFYTDGYCDGPFTARNELFVKCPECSNMICKDKAELVRVVSSTFDDFFDYDRDKENELNETLRQIKGCHGPTLQDYYSHVKDYELPPDHEKYIRTIIWWLENDKRRNVAIDDIEILSESERINLEKLLQLFDENNENDLLSRVEIFRELGNFEEAKKLLKRSFDEKYSKTVEKFQELIEEKNAFVSILLEE